MNGAYVSHTRNDTFKLVVLLASTKTFDESFICISGISFAKKGSSAQLMWDLPFICVVCGHLLDPGDR